MASVDLGEQTEYETCNEKLCKTVENRNSSQITTETFNVK